jgi:hypothetical protein
MAKPNGVFCLETPWAFNGSELTDRTSVEQQLRMLESAEECGRVIHRDVATRAEFDHYFKEWIKAKYRDKYPLGYLAFHGFSGGFHVGDTDLTLAELADTVGPKNGRGRILYFGSCSTMSAPEKELKSFCRSTGVKAIVGYSRTVGWRESAAFDCLLIPRLLQMTNMKSVYNGLKNDYSDLVTILGLRMANTNWATDRRIAKNAANASPT